MDAYIDETKNLQYPTILVEINGKPVFESSNIEFDELRNAEKGGFIYSAKDGTEFAVIYSIKDY